MDVSESREDFLQRIKKRKSVFKFCLVGDGATGKSTFMQYLESGELTVCVFDTKRTPYMDFGTAQLKSGTVQLFDLAGQRVEHAHPLDHIPETSLRGADIILFFFSLDNFQSFLSIRTWYDEIKGFFETWKMHPPPCFLIGNKGDLERRVEAINGQEMVEKLPDFKAYFETSLLSGENLEALISALEDQMERR